MLIQIPEIAIDDYTLSTHILCPRTHQPAPTSRVKPLRLRNKHYLIFAYSIYKMLGWLGRGSVSCVNHLNCVGWSEEFCFAGLLVGREHFEAVEVAAVSDVQFYEGVADL
jgi:hypothetical protein